MTKLIPILSGRCLVVELPDGSEFPRIGNGVLKAERTHNDYSVSLVRLPLPPGNWRIIGMLSEVNEADAATVVKLHATIKKYKDYLTSKEHPTNVFTKTALESLESAILAEGYYLDENPIPEPDISRYPNDDWIADYNNAQSRVLDRSRCLLLGSED